jgi:phosphatidylserine/phosphatidylglycerophosphate/cardiolipin synthase-like enzyme
LNSGARIEREQRRWLAALAASALTAICLHIFSCAQHPLLAHAQVASAVEQTLRQVQTEVHYSPAENLEALDLAVLDQAEHTIDVSTFAMDDKAIADELVKLAARGVQIRIYRDQIQYAVEVARGAKGRVNLNDEFKGQPNIHLRVKGVTALAHLKAYAVDGKLLREGSANWSPEGEKVQDNSLLLIRDPAVVATFERNFELIWNRPSNTEVQ